jgi:hypothetical protein
MKNCLSISLRTSSIKLREVLVHVPYREAETEGVKMEEMRERKKAAGERWLT